MHSRLSCVVRSLPLVLALLPTAAAPKKEAPGGAAGSSAMPPAPATSAAASGASAPAEFAPLDLPDFVVLRPEEGSKTLPWILIVDDPQCPYCMQLHLALDRERE